MQYQFSRPVTCNFLGRPGIIVKDLIPDWYQESSWHGSWSTPDDLGEWGTKDTKIWRYCDQLAPRKYLYYAHTRYKPYEPFLVFLLSTNKTRCFTGNTDRDQHLQFKKMIDSHLGDRISQQRVSVLVEAVALCRSIPSELLKLTGRP